MTPKLYRGEYSSVVGVPIMASVNGNAQLVAAVMPRLDPAEAIALADKIVAADDLLEACKAAFSALRSYQYGNASTDLAKSVADHLAVTIAAAEGGKR
jgi:hypothetical protein